MQESDAETKGVRSVLLNGSAGTEMKYMRRYLGRDNVSSGDLMERTYGYVIASRSLKGEIKQMQVAEDFASRPHKAITFVVEREKENQEWRDQNGPKNLGFSGGYQEGARRKKAEKWRKKKWKGKKLKKKESKASLGNKRTLLEADLGCSHTDEMIEGPDEMNWMADNVLKRRHWEEVSNEERKLLWQLTKDKNRVLKAGGLPGIAIFADTDERRWSDRRAREGQNQGEWRVHTRIGREGRKTKI